MMPWNMRRVGGAIFPEPGLSVEPPRMFYAKIPITSIVKKQNQQLEDALFSLSRMVRDPCPEIVHGEAPASNQG